MKLRSLWPILALALACGPDAEPRDCHAAPDFQVTILAADGPLPEDLVIKLRYGGLGPEDPEELSLAAPHQPQALFCYVADRNGIFDVHEPALGNGGTGSAAGDAGAGGAAEAAGAGGAEGVEPGPIAALVCKLWTNGPANLVLETSAYPKMTVTLETRKDKCTVLRTIELAQPDGGVED